ncbi:helix-turn-helix domain-containing protein [Chitinophaga sp. sic0106]|uniref:helix-turn-helix domain-containing protein n=1 Tax=Chitinophaga sp. sic0106 TaxID=2854785 RepID=UPI001C43A16A|nr:helix-turn-helix transcriptional regulator [Chitinophaga sp. sic0106]MBV7530668.1 helix-turn-helix transcriptional regulator [Chitinophaga sp. sic0106]
MKKFEDIGKKHHSELLEDLVGKITPAEQEKVDYKMGIAAKIGFAMKKKGWKQIDLMKALDINSPSIISKYLSGTHNFTVDTLIEIGQALDIDLLNISLEEKLRGKKASKLTFTYDIVVNLNSASLKEELTQPLQTVVDEHHSYKSTSYK